MAKMDAIMFRRLVFLHIQHILEITVWKDDVIIFFASNKTESPGSKSILDASTHLYLR